MEEKLKLSRKARGLLISGIVLALLIAVFPLRIYYNRMQDAKEWETRTLQTVEEERVASERIVQITADTEAVRQRIDELEVNLKNLQQRNQQLQAGAHGFHRWVYEFPSFTKDAVLNAAKSTIEPLLSYGVDDGSEGSPRSREGNLATFEASGVIDLNGAFTRLFLDDSKAYIATSSGSLNRCVSTNALGVYMTNQGPEGPTIGYHPAFQYDWSIVDLTENSALVLAELELSFISDTVFARSLPVVLFIDLEGSGTDWQVTSVETYIRFGSRVHPEDGIVVRDWVGRELDVE